MGHSIFKADDELVIRWFKQKGYSGSLNEMIIQYFKAKLGGSPLGYSNDLIAVYLRQQGYSGSVGDMLNSFFCNKIGVYNAIDAQRLFFSNPLNDFTSYITLISNTQAGSSNGTDVTTSAIDTTGAKFLVISASYSTAAPTITDSKSNTWTALTAQTTVGSGINRLYYVANPTVGTNHTFTNTGNVPSISVMAFSNVILSSPFDVEGGGVGNTVTSKATGSITPSLNNELVITGLQIDGSLTTDYVVDSGFTANTYVGGAGGIHVGCGMAYKIQTTAAAVNPTWSGTSANFAVTIASFKNG